MACKHLLASAEIEKVEPLVRAQERNAYHVIRNNCQVAVVDRDTVNTEDAGPVRLHVSAHPKLRVQKLTFP